MEQNETTLDHIKTHADAVIHFIKNLDIDMVDYLLDEKYSYQDLKKNFLSNSSASLLMSLLPLAMHNWKSAKVFAMKLFAATNAVVIGSAAPDRVCILT